MLRKLGLSLAVAMLAACDGSDGKQVTKDAGTPDSGAGIDAAVDAGPTGPLVTNAGAACAEDSDCEGARATCQTTVAAPLGQGAPVNLTFPDGYCTATCTTQDECARGSECGVKKLVETLGPLLMGMGLPPGALDMIPSQCLDLCMANGECRDGYVCQNLIDASGQGGRLPAGAGFLFSKYCLPAPVPTPAADGGADDAGNPDMDAAMPTPDASVFDAGRDAAVLDAGTGDAGAGDAGTGDAGTGDASTGDASF